MTATPLAFPLITGGGQWPPQILEFAAQRQGQMYLDPLVAAARRLFPTALSIELSLAVDPEIASDRHLVLDVRVPLTDVPDFVTAVHQWTEEKYRLCPPVVADAFRLVLTRVTP